MVDLNSIKSRVVEALKSAQPKIDVSDVRLELAQDDDGDEFLRVIIQLKHPDNASDEDYVGWLETIENAVGDAEGLYPSVRFADAA